MSNTSTTNAATVPVWNTRAKIRKATPSGDVVPGEYACGGCVVRVSPRYQKHGTTFRVRPESAPQFFAAWAQENGLLPTPLTPEEASSADGLAILSPLFAACRDYFKGLEPAVTAGDAAATPDLTTGFSFLAPQVLVEKIGFAATATSGLAPVQPTVGQDLVAEMARKIEEMRAKKATKDAPAKPEAKAKKSS